MLAICSFCCCSCCFAVSVEKCFGFSIFSQFFIFFRSFFGFLLLQLTVFVVVVCLCTRVALANVVATQQLKREIGSKNLSPVLLLMKALGTVDGVCGYSAARQMTVPHAVIFVESLLLYWGSDFLLCLMKVFKVCLTQEYVALLGVIYTYEYNEKYVLKRIFISLTDINK